MDSRSHFRSLSRELQALRDRVRNFIADAHWQTDGEWKESVLRSALRRNLPDTVKVGRGFILSGDRTSSQIDVLIYDSSKPVLFQDSDLVFITPDAVKGLIEVKSRVTLGQLADVLEKICQNIDFVRGHGFSARFAALFAYDSESPQKDQDAYLEVIRNVSDTRQRLVNFATLGPSKFIRYWDLNPENHKQLHERWHSYHLKSLAYGYFLHNVVEAVCGESVVQHEDVWYPRETKEPFRVSTVHAEWAHDSQ